MIPMSARGAGPHGQYTDAAHINGTLEIRVLEATDLVEKRKERRPRGFFGGTSSATDAPPADGGADYVWPYVTIRAGNGQTRRSFPSILSLSGKDTSVTWHEDFAFDSVKATQQVIITAFINRRAGDTSALDDKSAVVGEVLIPVVRLPEGHAVEQWYQLTPREPSKLSKAAIKLRLFYQVREDFMVGGGGQQAVDGLGGPDEAPAFSHGGSGMNLETSRSISMDQTHLPTTAGQGGERAALHINSSLQSEILEDPPSPQPLPTPSNMVELAQEELPTGLVDYFCIMGPRIDEATGLPNLSNGAVLLRHPLEDKPEQPLPESPQFFCFPSGMALSYGPKPPKPEPLAYTFVIKHSGVASYGVCLHFHRKWIRLSQEALSPSVGLIGVLGSPLDDSRSPAAASAASGSCNPLAEAGGGGGGLGGLESPNAQRGTVWAPVCLCLLTRVPVVQPLLQWLVQAYDNLDKLLPRDYDSLLNTAGGGNISILLRSHIVQLTLEVPLPIPGALGVQFDFLGRVITCRLPGPGTLPSLCYPLSPFLHTFSARNVLALVAAALTESKILLHSRDLALLPVMAESLMALMYPLQWQHPYLVPLPKELMVVIETPTNYILGIHTDWLVDVSRESLKDVVLVDCDSGAVRLPPRPYNPPTLPPNILDPLMKRLRSTVHPALEHLDSAQVILDEETFRRAHISPLAEQELRLLFVRCMAYLLSGYHDCIFYIDPTSPIFNRSRFMSEYAPQDEQIFLARLLDTQSFQAFLENQEGPYIDLFRKQLHRAFSRATSRPTSPLPGQPGGGQGNGPSKKCIADFGISEDNVSEWLDEGNDDVFAEVNARPGGGASTEADVKLMLTIPSPPVDGEEEGGEGVDMSITTSTGTSCSRDGDPGSYSKVFKFLEKETRRASAPASTSTTDLSGEEEEEEKSEGTAAAGVVRFATRGESCESEESSMSMTASPSKMTRKKSSSRKLALSLLASPSKPARSQSFGEFELDVLMKKTMNLGSNGAGPLTPDVMGTSSGGGGGVGSEEAAAYWREPRRWTVDEASDMMDVSVRDMARALGLNFDLQRVMTRGHTIFGFADPSSMLDAGGAGSPHGFDGNGAMSEDNARLNRCLMEAFSTEKPSKELLQEVEGAFRLTEVRERFLTILSQPRSKRVQQHQRQGGPAGQFRIHSNGFEALMHLASAVCNACANEREYLTAHILLQLMGKYYRVLDAKDSNHAWATLRAEPQQKEFLSSRLRHHQIFQSVELWMQVLREQLENDEGGGFKLAPRPLNATISTSSKLLNHGGGLGGTSKLGTTTTNMTTTGGNLAATEAPEMDSRKFVQRVKSLLMEMHGVGMPDQKALAFVGRVCEMYKPNAESKQSLVKLAHRIWKIPGGPQQHQSRLSDESHHERVGTRTARRSSLGESEGGQGGAGGRDRGSGGGGEGGGHFFAVTPRGKSNGEADQTLNMSTSLASSQSQQRRVSFGVLAPEKNKDDLPTPTPTPPVIRTRSNSPMAQMMGGGNDNTSTHKGPVLCLDVDAEGSLGVSGGGDRLLVVYSILQRSRITSFSGHTGPVTCVKIFNDKAQEPLVASASLDSTLRIWKLGSGGGGGGYGIGDAISGKSLLSSFTTARDVRGVLTGHSRGIVCMDKSEDLQLIATGAMDRMIKLWNVTQGRNTATLVGHTATVSCVRLMEQAQAYRILSASHDRTMILWDSGRGSCLRVYRSHESWIRQVESWGKDLAVTASNDRTIRIWDLRVHNCVQKLTDHRGAVTCLQVSEDADAPLLFSGSTDATVKVWDLRAGGRCTASLEGHTEAVTCLGLQQQGNQGRKLVSAGEDKRLVEWDARSGVMLQSRMGHRDGISSLKISKKGVIITGSWDHSVRLWEGTPLPHL